MIKELSELGKTLRGQKTENEWVHDALKEEIISLVLTIKPNGSFISLQGIEKKKTMAEAVQRTSGKEARLLIDNCGYVLGVYDCESNAFKKKAKEKGEQKAHDIFNKDVSEKLALFLKRLGETSELEELKPVFKFYKDNKQKGIDIVNQEYFLKNISKKDRGGNIALLVSDKDKYVHEYDSVYRRIIDDYERKQQEITSSVRKKCAICVEEQFPVGDFTHFPIKGVPGDKEPAGGRKLISYNGDNNPFESYGMVGNENSMICTNCAKTYVEGLNWLLSSGTKIKNKKNKDDIVYTNRWPRKRSASFGVDTAMVFWTRKNEKVDEIDYLEAPNPDDVSRLIESVASGTKKYIEADQFYSCTLSGSAARIAVRDWIETSLFDFRKSIALWFRDIAIDEYDADLKKTQTHYARLYDLARCCQRKNSDGSYDKDDASLARVAAYLWSAALKNTSPPLWMLTKVLQRSRLDGVTADRAALIKLILNRHKKGGDFVITERIEQGNRPVAYVCGQIFARLEGIQYAALGNVNAGIRERYFTYAMTSPASAFGRLFNLNSKHFTKLKNEKPGLAITLDKELQELCKDVDIRSFPATFSLEQQGQFAIGYYHQRQSQFSGSK
ncbi:MAG TPA: type I-C CRISPR-associated protein Cas8c/Csd1 [Candidatus Wunengus sp. YC60]|uniref:type I-C CRISPR-associated protein Cas8c/Csd1 n=1 Tax=Candidatus Wunengus sp. YC60 TaxID=3367697 RepID=UPI0040287AE8